jgi:hypothetical protein
MHAAGSYVRHVILQLLHAIGITDRAISDHLVVGLGSFIIFGLLGIFTLKVMLVRRAERKQAADGPALPPPTTASKAWKAWKIWKAWKFIRPVVWIGGLLAVSILIALRLDS